MQSNTAAPKNSRRYTLLIRPKNVRVQIADCPPATPHYHNTQAKNDHFIIPKTAMANVRGSVNGNSRRHFAKLFTPCTIKH